MKSMWIYISMLLVLFSCELVETEKEVVLGTNDIPAEVNKIYVAVLDGEEVLSIKVYDKNDTNPDGSVEIFTSPGENRTFVVVALNLNDEVIYYAHNTENIDNDSEAVIELSMRIAVWNVEASGDEHLVSYNYGNGGDHWETTGIVKTKYIFWNTRTDSLFYETYSDSADLPYETGLQFFVEFYPFGVRTSGAGL